MNYISTRGYNHKAASSEAILSGIAPDGGLYVPEFIPKFSDSDLPGLYNADYQEIAYYVMAKYLTDFGREQLTECISKAYNIKAFDTPLICPLRPLTDSIHLLELWHGPTCAFKDMALQLLPYLMTTVAKNLDDRNTIVVLTATSGDTGKAALEGFKDVPGTKIIVFYPENGVSAIQKLQMVTQEGSNVSVVGIHGNFDHTQSGVKEIFTDKFLAGQLKQHGYRLTSANSINWGRLLPQIVYYFSSYINLLKSSHIKFGDKINVCVPTGNFGNIMAAYYAKMMGLPINKLIIATNKNNVLVKFLNTGTYNINRKLKTTISPSMDILISSNFERLLFEISGHSHQYISALMEQLARTGKYTVSSDVLDTINQHFFADYANEENTLRTIKDTYSKYKYVLDPHTAVGMHVYRKYVEKTNDSSPTVLVSTASPYKFNQSVLSALSGQRSTAGKSEFELLNILSAATQTLAPKQLRDLGSKSVLHTFSCEKKEMKDTIRTMLKI